MTRQKEKILSLVTEAKERDDHLALGYSSWPAYVAAEFATALSDLTRDDRRWAAFALSQTGMSSRAIAPIVGVSDRQVRHDLEQVGHDVPPADVQVKPGFGQVGSDFPPAPEGNQDDHFDEALAAVSKITATALASDIVGVDGKTYVRTARIARQRRRTSLADQYRDAVYDLRRNVRRLEKLTADDRFGVDRDLIAKRHREELAQVSKAIWQMRGAVGDGGNQ